MITINEDNVIAMKPANIESLKNIYNTSMPKKPEVTPLVNDVPVDINVPSAPETTNADLLANEFAIPAVPPQPVPNAQPISEEAPKVIDFPNPSPQTNAPETLLSNQEVLEVMTEIAEIQARLDNLGGKIIQLFPDQKIKDEQVIEAEVKQPVENISAIPEPTSLAPSTQPESTPAAEIIPFTPASENIFDQPMAM